MGERRRILFWDRTLPVRWGVIVCRDNGNNSNAITEVEHVGSIYISICGQSCGSLYCKIAVQRSWLHVRMEAMMEPTGIRRDEAMNPSQSVQLAH